MSHFFDKRELLLPKRDVDQKLKMNSDKTIDMYVENISQNLITGAN